MGWGRRFLILDVIFSEPFITLREYEWCWGCTSWSLTIIFRTDRYFSSIHSFLSNAGLYTFQKIGTIIIFIVSSFIRIHERISLPFSATIHLPAPHSCCSKNKTILHDKVLRFYSSANIYSFLFFPEGFLVLHLQIIHFYLILKTNSGHRWSHKYQR